MKLLLIPLLFFGLLISVSSADEYDQCLAREIQQANDDITVGTIKKLCEEYPKKQNSLVTNQKGLVTNRIALERSAGSNRFTILPHKTSYILPLTYNSKPNNLPFELESGESDLDNYELKFQFSFKTQLLDTLFDEQNGLYFAYTNQSYWQHLDSKNSGPFRETNHEPELFFDWHRNINLGDWHIPLVRLGWVHKSNGQSASLSRSWNRLYGELLAERDNWAISFRPWLTVTGVTKETDSENIDDFMGNFELGFFRQGQSSSLSLLLRNNLQKDNRGAVELNWSTPLPYNNKVRFFFQYFYGYGESLVDFDQITNRAGIGLQLSDFL